jgi:uncharacterized membrane protein
MSFNNQNLKDEYQSYSDRKMQNRYFVINAILSGLLSLASFVVGLYIMSRPQADNTVSAWQWVGLFAVVAIMTLVLKYFDNGIAGYSLYKAMKLYTPNLLSQQDKKELLREFILESLKTKQQILIEREKYPNHEIEKQVDELLHSMTDEARRLYEQVKS